MRKKDMKKLALLGLTAGFLTSASADAADKTSTTSSTTATKDTCPGGKCPGDKSKDPNSENVGYHLMTEDELMENLNAKSRKIYEGLDAEGKALVLKVASQRCNGTNDCKGLNACQTEKNDCAGKGECKGKSKCAFADKNLVVKIVAKKMEEKRAKLKN